MQGFVKLAAPHHQLVAELTKTSKERKRPSHLITPDNWTLDCEQGFQQLKTALVSAPVLAFADFKKDFLVEVDASHQGLGAVLSHLHEGKLKLKGQRETWKTIV